MTFVKAPNDYTTMLEMQVDYYSCYVADKESAVSSQLSAFITYLTTSCLIFYIGSSKSEATGDDFGRVVISRPP